MLEFDHIAISGETLGAAQHYVEEALGVALQPGGEHSIFHTHNALLGLEDGLYLEAIAINPNAPKPDRARWFDLDRFAGSPRLTNWICRAPQLSEILGKTELDFGRPVALERGDLRWQMAVPTGGILPFDNCAPALIQWDVPHHPAQRLAPSGVRLTRLTIRHPEARALQAALAPDLADDRLGFEEGAPELAAEFATPHGPRSLTA